MSLAEEIYKHSLSLPESAAREALDFIEFLEQRYAKSALDSEKNDKKRAAALEQISAAKVHWDGKPIADRDELYDQARE